MPSSTEYSFCFGSIHSFFLELFLHWSPVAYLVPTDLGSSSFSILSFCLFLLFKGFSRQEYWSGLPFPSLGDHILSDLSTMTWLSWVAADGMAYFHELDKTVVLWSDWLDFYAYGSVCLPFDALLQHLLSYLGFSYLWWGVSLYSCSCKAQSLLLTLDQGHLLMATPSDLARRVPPLGPAATPWPWGSFSAPLSLTSEVE